MTAQLSRSKVVRGVYLVVGAASLALGIIGLFLPLMPTTVFILIAAFFFARSSERLHDWITSHRSFGPLVRDFQAGLGIPLYAKVWAVAAIALSFGITMTIAVTSPGGRLALVATAAAICWYVVSRPTRRPASGEAGLRSNGSLES